MSSGNSYVQKTVEVIRENKNHKETIEETKEMLSETDDKEMLDMLKEEIADSEKQIPELEEQLKLLLLPKDPNDDKNVIIEIRGAAGGDEAQIFAGDLFRMYSSYAENDCSQTEGVDSNGSVRAGY